MRIQVTFSVLTAALLAGCSSFTPRAMTKNASVPSQQIAPEVTPVPLRLDAQPSQPERQLVMEKPAPVWSPTIIRKVRVDAYVDENGNLHEPTYKYVVERPGGWNLDAIRNKNGYIPPQNEAAPQNMPGFSYTGSAVEKDSTSVLQLFDLESGQVKLTGLVNEADEAQARAMCGLGEVALFDNRVGWIIVPQAVMDGVMQIDRANLIPKTLPRQTASAKPASSDAP